jgi:hypothetical protein
MKTATPIAVVLLLGSATVYAIDPPPMKEGLWTIHNQSSNDPGGQKVDQTSTVCRSHAYDQHVLQEAKRMKGCKTLSESLNGSEYSVHTQCKLANTVVDSRSTVIFRGDSAAHSESHATYNPALGGISEMTLIQDQRFVGSCPAGAQPGDITQPDGSVIHAWKH